MNKPCANCGLPLENGRYPNAKYCLRKACTTELNKKWDKNYREKLKEAQK